MRIEAAARPSCGHSRTEAVRSACRISKSPLQEAAERPAPPPVGEVPVRETLLDLGRVLVPRLTAPLRRHLLGEEQGRPAGLLPRVTVNGLDIGTLALFTRTFS